MVSVASRIKEALNIRQLTQTDLVKRTGISKGSISQYVSGYVEPKQNRIYLIAKALNVSEAWLMGYDVPMKRKDDISDNFSVEDNTLIEKWQRLSPDDRSIIEAMIDRMIVKEGDSDEKN